MPKLVPIVAKKMIKILNNLGFELLRTKGSHYFFFNSLTRQSTTVPIHSGEVLGQGILKQILRDIELPVEEYDRLRKKI